MRTITTEETHDFPGTQGKEESTSLQSDTKTSTTN
jgi:hypothetical protein